MTNVQRRVIKVLERMIEQAAADKSDAAVFAEELDIMLDGLAQDDFFGTEQQSDPRGDFRDRKYWSVQQSVEGIDD